MSHVAVLALAATLALAGCAPPPAPAIRRTEAQSAVMEWQDGVRANVRVWQAERERVGAAALACPGPQRALQPSAGAPLRDGIRQDRQVDGSRRGVDAPGRAERQAANAAFLNATTALALADWQLRQAAAEQRPDLCASVAESLAEADRRLQQARDRADAALRVVGLDLTW